jgi:hypothetical protein
MAAELGENRKRGGPPDVQEAFRILAGGSVNAAIALLDVIDNSESDSARVQASQALLDRVGLSARQQLSVTHSIPVEFRDPLSAGETQDPSLVIARRLAELSAPRVVDFSEADMEEDGIVVDAVLVPMDPPN